MSYIKKIFLITLFSCFSFFGFTNAYTHKDFIDLIQKSGNLDELESMINLNHSIIYETPEYEGDCINILLNTKSSNFEKDAEFYKYAEKLISLLPDSYWITKNKEGNYPIFALLKNKEYMLIKKSIKNTSDLNIENDKGQTPLTYVATYYKADGIQLIKSMLANGADINYKNSHGYTAIMYAAESNENIEIFDELYCSNEVNTDIKTGNGESLIILASKNKNSEILKYLLEKNHYQDSCDFYGKTPLMHACEQGLLDNAKVLVKHNQNINQCDNFGKTALMYAVENNQTVDISKFLIKNGADKKLRDKNGLSADDYKKSNAYLSRSKISNWKVVIIVLGIILIILVIFLLILNSGNEYRFHFDK